MKLTVKLIASADIPPGSIASAIMGSFGSSLRSMLVDYASEAPVLRGVDGRYAKACVLWARTYLGAAIKESFPGMFIYGYEVVEGRKNARCIDGLSVNQRSGCASLAAQQATRDLIVYRFNYDTSYWGGSGVCRFIVCEAEDASNPDRLPGSILSTGEGL